VAHSPTPSAVRIAARRAGEPKKAAAACAWWCSVKRMRSPGTPSSEAIVPLTQSLPPSAFFIAWGKLPHDRGKPRSAMVRMRSNLSIGFS
jgi:hypothetical protein